MTFSNETYYAFILGFDHNSLYEGTNKLHMCFGKTVDGMDIAFCDAGYGNYKTSGFILHNEGAGSGWDVSYMRNTICAQFLNVLPSDIKECIASCDKYSYNSTNTVSVTSDMIWILSEFEVLGVRQYGNVNEKTYQQQYTYFKNGNSVKRSMHN